MTPVKFSSDCVSQSEKGSFLSRVLIRGGCFSYRLSNVEYEISQHVPQSNDKLLIKILKILLTAEPESK